jgi:hypothetical protein
MFFSTIAKSVEAFIDKENEENFAVSPELFNGNGQNNLSQLIAYLVAMVITLLIVSLIGKYLWNYSLVPLVSVVKPAKNVYQILGLYILASLMFSR